MNYFAGRSDLSKKQKDDANLFEPKEQVPDVDKIKFFRGTPRALYRSAMSHFLEDFKAAPLEVGVLVPRPGLAMQIRSEHLKGRTVPAFSVTDLDGLVDHLFERHETELRPAGRHALRNIVRAILNEHADDFPTLVRNGTVSEGVLDDLLTLTRTIDDFQADLSKFRPDPTIGIDVPKFISLYQERLERLGLVDQIGKRRVLVRKVEQWTEERPFFRKLVVIGMYEPTPSQLAVLRALVQGCGEVVYHHPYVPGKERVFKDPLLDLGRELEVIDLNIDQDEEKRLATVEPWGSREKVDLSEGIVLGRFLDPLEECRQVAQMISDLLAQGESADSIAMFLPERREALPLVREVLADFSIPFRTDLGAGLSTSPAVHAAMSLLEVVAEDYDAAKLIRTLASPYVVWVHDSEVLRHEDVDRYSRMAGITRGKGAWSRGFHALIEDLTARAVDPEVPEVRRRELERDAARSMSVKRSIDALLKELERLEGRKPFSEHLKAFRAVLNTLDIAKQLERSRWSDPEGDQIRAFYTLLELLDSLQEDSRSDTGDMDLRDVVTELRREIGEMRYHPGPRFDRAVSVAGYRSLAGSSFKHSFLMFTMEGDMPKLGAKHPFITASQAQRMGLLGEEDMLRQERFHFLSAILSGDRVCISYPSYRSDRKVLPSPFIEDLRRNCSLGDMERRAVTRSRRCAHISLGKAIAGGSLEGIEEWLTRSTISPTELRERLQVERVLRQGPYRSEHDAVLSDEKMLEDISSSIKDRVFSATMLETYRKCPFSYLMRYVLHLYPLEGEEGSEALRTGNAAHRILFRFYKGRMERGLGMPSPEEVPLAKAEMRRLAEEVREELMTDDMVSEATFRALVGDDLMNGILGRFIDHQANDDRPRWTPTHLEFGFGLEPSPDRSDAGSRRGPAVIALSDVPDDLILLRGKVDRIDAKDDMFFIIDYKTGSIPSFTSIAKGYDMQLPLYLMACEQLLGMRAAGGAYYLLRNSRDFGVQLRTASPDLKGELGGSGKAYEPGLRADMEICRGNVKGALEGIRQGRFHPVDDLDSERCPNHCIFSRICRRDDMRVLRMSMAREVGP